MFRGVFQQQTLFIVAAFVAVLSMAGCGATPAAASNGVTSTASTSSVFSSTTSFDEEFNESTLNTAVWAYRGLGVRNSCTVTANAVTVANGYARISIYTANNASGVATNYCGAISTQSTFLQTYGYWEANVRMGYQQGMQSSFWIQSPTIGATVGNPQQSGVEMDVFEHITSQSSATAYDHALHWNGYTSGIEQSAAHDGTQANLNDGNFHKFGLAWTPGVLTFSVDGVQTWQLAASDAAISDIAQYVILDTELPSSTYIPSGGYGALGSSSNAYLDVDYVHVYPYTQAVTSTTLVPTANAYVQDGGYAGTNFGGSTTLYTKSDATGYDRNTFLKFDLSSLSGTVEQATVYLVPVALGENNIYNTAYSVADTTWTESGITWNNQPAAGTALSTGLNLSNDVLTYFDVTAHAASGAPFSIEIGPDTPTGSPTAVQYGALENATTAYRPTLFVVYSK